MSRMIINIGKGQELDTAIAVYIKRKYNITIGARAAEEIKILVGSAMPLNENIIMDVHGRDQTTVLPRIIRIHANEVTEAMTEPLDVIIAMIRARLEALPDEQISKVVSEGVIITGPAALLRNITDLLQEVTGVPHHVADDAASA